MIKNLLTNWKTTSAGLTMIIGAVVHLVFHVLDGTADEATWKNDLIGVTAGIGLLCAGDAAASSSKKEVEDVKTAVISGDTSLLKKPDPKS
jgi:hypothetical protein